MLCIRLSELFLPETDCVAVLFDSFLNAVFDVKRIIRVPRIVGSNRHDHLLQQVVVLLQHVEFCITDHPAWGLDGERVTRDAHHNLLVAFFAGVDAAAIGIFGNSQPT